jgi:hypothetical protein
MRNRVWFELTQAKHHIEFTTLYAEVQRRNLRYFNISILVFSTSGVMGWKIWGNWPVIACVIITVVSLIRLIQPHIIMSDNQISNLDKISNFYSNYFNKLEELWYDSEHGIKEQESIKMEFYKIKETELEFNNIINETVRNKPKKILEKAINQSDTFFRKTYNTKK